MTHLQRKHCHRRNHSAFRQVIAAILIGTLPMATMAQIVPSGAHAPGVISTANGLPQVNINKPSAGGVSLNTYSQFDVQKPGAILNNSPTIVNTQLAGQISGNPNYGLNDAAHVIVNQVNSNNPSLLRGYVEVAGPKADVVVSNSSGIVVDGGGFINTARGVLTTGAPVLDANGSLTGLTVTGGNITVQGGGLDASNMDEADLVARAVQVNAAIHGKTLNVVAGANQVDYAGLQATPIAGTGAAPTVAIDVKQLGGMYADRITLVGTENGVGVSNAGALVAQAGDLTLTASGQLVQSGQMAATGSLAVTTTGDVDNTGSMIGDKVAVNAPNVSNTGAAALIAGGSSVGVYAANTLTNADGAMIYSSGNIELARDSARDASGLLADQTGTITNSAATIEAAGNLDVAAHTLNNQRTGVQIDPGTPVTTTGSTLSLWTAGLSWGQLGWYFSDFYPQWWFNAGAIGIGAASVLSAPLTVTLPSWQVTNINTANQTFSLTTPLTDQWTYYSGGGGDVGNPPTKYVVAPRTITQNPTQYYRGLTNNGNGTITISFWPDYNPTVNIEPDQVRGRIDLGADSHDYVEVSRTPSITTTTERVLNPGTAALIQAQGAIRVNADGGVINNDSSTMTAGGDLTRRAVGGAVNDVGTVLQQTRTETDTSTFYWHAKTSGDDDWRSVVDAAVPLANTVVDALPSAATSNQAVQVSAGDIHIGSANLPGQAGTGASQTLGGMAIPGLALPSNALYTYHAAPGSGPLIETDPRFTRYTNFISSDYLLQQVGANPQVTPKRLGDGAYEEQLVMNQVTQLTGKTFLGSYTDNLDEYTALMQSGAQVAKQFGLTVGVGLTADQMSKLTGDMVWLVNQTVTLPDGMQQTVLVPKLYLAQADTVNLKASGALVAGRTVNLAATGNIANSGTVTGSTSTTVAGSNVLNLGTIGAGGATTVAAAQDVINLGGQIKGTDTQVTAGRDIVNQSTTLQAAVNTGNGSVYSNATGMAIQSVGTISGTHNVALAAGRDVDLYGAAVQSGGDTSITAGRNLNASTLTLTATQDAGTTDGLNGGHFNTTTHVGSTITTGGNLTTVSGGDTTLTDATLQAQGDAALLAGGNLTVTAAKDTSSYNGQSMGGSLFHHKDSTYDETVQGTGINAGASVTLAAGQGAGATGNLSILGSSVTTGGANGTAGGAVNLQSTGDIAVGTVAEEHDAQHWSHGSSSGFLSHEETTTTSTSKQSLAVGSTVFGNTMGASAGRNLSIVGSVVGATNDVALAAQGNVGIEAATSTWDQSSHAEDNASGLMGSGGIGFTIGTRKQSEDDHSAGTTAVTSTVGSINGNVGITAGNQYRQIGSNVITSKGDIGIQGKQVDIVDARQSAVGSQESKFEQTGLTVALSAPVVSALQTVAQMAQAASRTSDTRSKALAAGAAALTLYNSAGAFNSLPSTSGSGGASGSGAASGGGQLSISLTVGHSHSDDLSTQASNAGVGSTVAAGGNVSIVATGAGQQSNVRVQGSDVSAGGNALLKADNQVNLLASQNTSSERSQNFSSSAAAGVAITVGHGVAFGVTASGSLGKGHTNSDDVSNINSQVMAANTLTIKSGGDTTLKGAVAGGKQVVADVGGNLNLQSLQDTSKYDGSQMNVAGSVTVGYGASGSLSFSDSSASGDYASVNGQTGIKAGDGGFQIGVQGNTDLQGAAIASSQAAVDQGKNSLTTGTLTTSDIANHSNYSASGIDLSGGYSVGFGGKGDNGQQGTGGSTPGNGATWSVQNFTTGAKGAAAGFSSESGSQSSTTRSGISGGAVTITNSAAQQAATGQTAGQAVAGLNRDVTSTSGADGLTKTWDGQQLQKEVASNAQITAVFGQQASTAIGDYASQQIKQADALRAQAVNDPAHAAELNAQADTLQAEWGANGTLRIAAHTVVGALTGGIVGAAGAMVGTLAAPQVSHLLNDAGIKGPLADTLTALASTAAGAAVGGAAGASAAQNEVVNNCLDHPDACGQDDFKKAEAEEISKEEALLGGQKAIVGYSEDGEPITVLEPTGAFVGQFGGSGATKSIATPYGPALQSNSPAALDAISQVQQGATLFRIGTLGQSQTAEAQFWSLQNPLTTPNYSGLYGIPPENVTDANFVETAILQPGTPFITRPAPSVGTNLGGGIEVVVPSGGVQMKYFGTQGSN